MQYDAKIAQRLEITFFATVIVLVAIAACLAGYMHGRKASTEDITAACVRDGTFEFRTFVYDCRLTPESQARLNDEHTEI